MKIRSVVSLILLTATAVGSGDLSLPPPLVFAQSASLVVRLRTSSGTPTDVAVRNTDTGDELLNELGGYLFEPAKSRLAVRTTDRSVLLLPWNLVREVGREGTTHTVELADGSRQTGRLQGTITQGKAGVSFDSADTKYDLGAVLSLSVVTINPGRTESPTPVPTWTLSVPGPTPKTYEGTSPRFVYRYYTRSGFVAGGYRRQKTNSFGIALNGKRSNATIEDFEVVDVRAAAVSVQGKDGSSASGQFILAQNDSDGEHMADSGWLLALDLPSGAMVAVREVPWKLVRRR